MLGLYMQGIVIERFYWEDLMVNWSLDDPDFDARFFHAGFEFADGGHSIVQDAVHEEPVHMPSSALARAVQLPTGAAF